MLFKISFKFLTYNLKKFLMLSLIITFGTAIFYFIFQAAKGLERKAFEYASLGEAHITVTLPQNELNNELLSNLEDELYQINEIVHLYYSMRFYGLSSKGKNFLIKGIDFDDQDSHYYQIINNITFGSNPTNKEEIVVGGTLAINFRDRGDDKTYLRHNEDLGKTINLYLLNEDSITSLQVVKIFTSDVIGLKDTTIFMDYQAAKYYTNLNYPTTLEIKLTNPLNSDKVVNKIDEILSNHLINYNILQWSFENEQIINIIYVEKIAVIITQIITGLAISLGIMNVLSFNIREKIRQIGILKAMGINKLESNLIFIIQIALVSIISIILGLLFGYGLTILFQSFAKASSGDVFIKMDTYFFNNYTYIVFGAMLLFNLLGSIQPIRNVNKLEIVEIIKSS